MAGVNRARFPWTPSGPPPAEVRELPERWSVQESARSLARRLQYYSQQGLLVVDELGYLSYDARAADLLFQVVSRRYERRSLVLTTNLPFSDWPTIFPNAATVTALIDRVVHHADIISLEGESYRRRVGESVRKPSRDTLGR